MIFISLPTTVPANNIHRCLVTFIYIMKLVLKKMRTVARSQSQISSLLLPTILLYATIAPARSEVSISLINKLNQTLVYQNYSHEGFYNSGFSKEVYTTGFFSWPLIQDCNDEPLPPAPNSSWFAIVANHSSCFDEIIDKICSANYSVVVISSDISAKVKNIGQYEVPVVVVTTRYMEYLIGSALSEFDAPAVAATIVADNALIVFLLEVGTSLLLLTALCVVALCCGLLAKWHRTPQEVCCSTCYGNHMPAYKKVPSNNASQYQNGSNL